jgi:peptidoglycan hydrolase FlgJ
MKLPTIQGTTIQGTTGVPRAGEQKKLKSSCEEFEAILTNVLFKSMRETISKANPEEGDNAQELYESMLDDAVAKELSHGPGLGLGKLLYQQLSSQMKSKI